jgi:small GTP-binding protein
VTAALEAAGAVRRGVHEAAAAGLLGDPLTAEVALALPAARTMTAVRLLTHQRGAGVGRWAEEWRAWLAAAPRGAGDLWPLHTTAQWLLARSAALRRLLDPPRVAIVGAPNAGKSTLANALLGRMVSIASDVPGTTRDWVEAPVHLAGANGIEVAVTLVDTAGVRATTDPLERESIRRTEAQARAADVVVVVVDATRPWSVGEWDRLTGDDQPVVVVLNKWDLVTAGEARGADEAGVVHLSALRQTGLEGLMTAVLGQLDLADVHPEEPFVFSARQRALVEELAVARDPETCGALLGGLAGRAAADPLPPAPRDTMPA